MKNACDKAYSRGIKVGYTHVEVPKEENMVDISLLPEKKRNKILNQKKMNAKKATNKALREAMRATTKAVKEATVAIEMEAKKVEKLKKSKAITPPLLLIETSYASPSQNPCKLDAS